MNTLNINQPRLIIPTWTCNRSKQPTDILSKLLKLNTQFLYRTDPVLIKQLREIQPKDLTHILNRFFEEMIQKYPTKDPIKFLDRLTRVIPLEKLQGGANGATEILKEARGMFEEARYYLQMTNEKVSPSLRERLDGAICSAVKIIENVIAAFGVGDFIKVSESELHGDFKSQKMMMLFTLFTTVTTLLVPVVGSAIAALIVGGFFLVTAVLSIIWPRIKPMTSFLPANAENWTLEVRNKTYVGDARKETLDQIANILKMKRHAILVGPSRVGKSLTAKIFAQALARGDYPELKGKVVFRINTAEIIGQQASLLGGGDNILKKISDAMGRHRNNIILVFDEIHMACKNNEKIAEKLKTFLDEGGDFPYVIGITTDIEYEKYVKDNRAFSLRFDKVEVDSTNRDETIKILSDTILNSQSRPLANECALDRIYEKSTQSELHAPQPVTSLTLLKKCINRTGKTQLTSTEKNINDLARKILSLRSRSVACRSGNSEIREQIADLEKQIEGLKKVLVEEKEKIDSVFKMKQLFDRVKLETYKSAIKVSAIAKTKLNTKDQKTVKLFLLLKEVLWPYLESRIIEASKLVGIHTMIDNELVEVTAGG